VAGRERSDTSVDVKSPAKLPGHVRSSRGRRSCLSTAVKPQITTDQQGDCSTTVSNSSPPKSKHETTLSSSLVASGHGSPILNRRRSSRSRKIRQLEDPAVDSRKLATPAKCDGAAWVSPVRKRVSTVQQSPVKSATSTECDGEMRVSPVCQSPVNSATPVKYEGATQVSPVRQLANPVKCDGATRVSPVRKGVSPVRQSGQLPVKLATPMKCDGEMQVSPVRQSPVKAATPAKCDGATRVSPVRQSAVKSANPVRCDGAARNSPVRQSLVKSANPMKCDGAMRVSPVRQSPVKSANPVRCDGAARNSPVRQSPVKSASPVKCGMRNSPVRHSPVKLANRAKCDGETQVFPVSQSPVKLATPVNCDRETQISPVRRSSMKLETRGKLDGATRISPVHQSPALNSGKSSRSSSVRSAAKDRSSLLRSSRRRIMSPSNDAASNPANSGMKSANANTNHLPLSVGGSSLSSPKSVKCAPNVDDVQSPSDPNSSQRKTRSRRCSSLQKLSVSDNVVMSELSGGGQAVKSELSRGGQAVKSELSGGGHAVKSELSRGGQAVKSELSGGGQAVKSVDAERTPLCTSVDDKELVNTSYKDEGVLNEVKSVLGATKPVKKRSRVQNHRKSSDCGQPAEKRLRGRVRSLEPSLRVKSPHVGCGRRKSDTGGARAKVPSDGVEILPDLEDSGRRVMRPRKPRSDNQCAPSAGDQEMKSIEQKHNIDLTAGGEELSIERELGDMDVSSVTGLNDSTTTALSDDVRTMIDFPSYNYFLTLLFNGLLRTLIECFNGQL